MSEHEPLSAMNGDEEEWDENGEEGYDDDAEIDAEAVAEEMARRLGDQLWADINKAQAAQLSQTGHTLPPIPPGPVPAPTSSPAIKISRKDEEVIATMKGVLDQAAGDSMAYRMLSSAIIPNTSGVSVWAMLNDTVAAGKVSRDSAWALSQQIIALAKSDVLFSSMRHSNAAVVQLSKGKRKREELDNNPKKRPVHNRGVNQHHPNVLQQLAQAVDAVIAMLNRNGDVPSNGVLGPSIIATVQPQLCQVFLFALTSSTPGGQEMNSLQELSGLIQAVGVLSGIQIAPHTSPGAFTAQFAGTAPQTDIECAVYPCLVANCLKTFSRLSHLRAHQRVHTVGRPFRCEQCPASFARNHDLKRHMKGHDTVGFKCLGCDKVFSRRDALKRHKNGNRKGATMCVDAQVQEVQVDKAGDEEEAKERRARIWSGITENAVGADGANSDEPEEGEIHPEVMKEARERVLRLYTPLQAYVSRTGLPVNTTRPTGRTLASVIAHAQVRSLSAVPYADQIWSSAHTLDLGTAGAQLSNASTGSGSLSSYGLSNEQALLLEQAIASAASAAQAQAEAEALLEDDEYEEEDAEGEDDFDDEGIQVTS